MWWMLTSVNRFFEKRIPYASSPVKRLLIQIIVTILLSSPILILVNVLSDVFFSHLEFMGPQFKAVAVVVFILVVTLINFSFYGAHFFSQWKLSFEEKAALQLRASEADKERLTVQYQHLKNQVNPHFLFNTLTSLDGLIHTNPPVASVFVRHLSKVYRYVLDHSENTVVNLQTEIDFINHYFSILSIRYGKGLHVNINVSESALEKGIAVVTLQMLIDNAVKHNTVNEKEPLVISIYDEDQYLVVENNKQLKNQVESSTKKGLHHLKQLYGYLHPTAPVIHETEFNFQVKLPLL